MHELTFTEMQEVSGAGTRIGTTGTGDGNLVGGSGTVAPQGGSGIRIGSDGSNN